VHWVSPTDVSTVVGSNQGVKRIVVIVSRDSVPVAQLQAIRTAGLPDVEACCFTDDTCLVTDADTCLALGGWPQGDNSDCYSSTCCTPAVVYEGLSKAAPPVPATEVMLDTPTGTGKDDLLIAVIVVSEWVSISPPLLSGWTEVAEQSHPVQRLTVGVWWKNAEFLEPGPHIFTWTAPGACYAWMARFTGHSMTNTIHAVGTGTGNSTDPPCPAVITSYDNCMILRVGGFDGEMITAGDPGLAGHAAITMGDSPGEGGCSGGAGYLMQPLAGDSGVATFTLTGDQEYVTLTIAVPAAECQ
jgi:hypothetical protein